MIQGESNYWHGGLNKNCPSDIVVKTENECRLAAAVLGLTYNHNPTMSPNRPAGCFGDLVSGEETVYLNLITDVSLATPTQFTEGICKGGIFIDIV